jgi:hypothetical protein
VERLRYRRGLPVKVGIIVVVGDTLPACLLQLLLLIHRRNRLARTLLATLSHHINLRLLKSHWTCMAAKSGLIQVGLVCESPKAQQINQRLYS